MLATALWAIRIMVTRAIGIMVTKVIRAIDR